MNARRLQEKNSSRIYGNSNTSSTMGGNASPYSFEKINPLSHTANPLSPLSTGGTSNTSNMDNKHNASANVSPTKLRTDDGNVGKAGIADNLSESISRIIQENSGGALRISEVSD